jgi:hypothetical protein
MNGRTQIVDLVPRSNRFFVALLLGGAAIVALLEALFAVMPRLSPHTTDGRVAAFDLDGEGSLCVWVSSFTLVAAAGCCLLNYALLGETGRARRLWLWTACCWTMMSIDECSSLHEGFKEMMSHLTGERIWHDGVLWWMIAYFLVLSTTGLALVWSMRKAPAAIAVLCGTACFYAVAVLCELNCILPRDTSGVMLEEGCELMGNFCVLASMGLFAKHLADSLRCAETEQPPESELLSTRFSAPCDETRDILVKKFKSRSNNVFAGK